MIQAVPQRNTSIDGLRGYAALTVMLYHFGPDYFTNEASLKWLWFGDYGPHIFFMISGLVIGLISGGQRRALVPFLKRRYHRLAPTYWAALALTAIVLILFTDRGPSVQQFVANVSLTHKAIGFDHVDIVYWTLIVEVTFYLLFALILLPLKSIRTQWVVLGAWLILSYLSLVLTVFGGAEHLAFKALQQVFILQHAPFFIIGLVMAYARQGSFNRTLLLLVVLSYIHIWLMYPSSRAAYLSGGFVIFSALVFYHSPLLSSKYLQLLGWISYPLYLTHREIGLLIIGHFEVHDYPVVGAFLAVGLSLALAYGLSVYFDRSNSPLYSSRVW